MSTLLLGAGVERFYWYLMRDYQTDVSNFDSMGLVRDADSPFGRYAPAPAYVAYATLIRELQGATYIRRESTDPRTEVHLFAKDGEEIRVAWSTGDAPRLQLATNAPLTRIDLMGNRRALLPADSGVSLLLSGTPIYLSGSVSELREWRPDVLVADSALDFSPQDQAGGWQYGAYDGDGEGSGDGAAPNGPASDDDFELLSPASDLWRRQWADPQLGPVRLDGGGGHPGLVGEQPVWAVRRWVSPFDGTVRVRGEIEPPNGGDGTRALILNDGTVVFSQALDPVGAEAPVSYDIEVEVRRGGALDFAITPGPGHDVDHDATAFSAAITLPLLADSVRDFSLVQGQRGWFYGFEGSADAAFTPFPPGEGWGGGPFGSLAIDQRGAHPAQRDGQPVRVTRRWHSDAEGPVRIQGEVAIWNNAGDGVRAWVLVDGQPVLTLDLGGPDGPDRTTYDVTTMLHAGSLVDFALDPGPDGNIDFDGSTFTAAIQKL